MEWALSQVESWVSSTSEPLAPAVAFLLPAAREWLASVPVPQMNYATALADTAAWLADESDTRPYAEVIDEAARRNLTPWLPPAPLSPGEGAQESGGVPAPTSTAPYANTATFVKVTPVASSPAPGATGTPAPTLSEPPEAPADATPPAPAPAAE